MKERFVQLDALRGLAALTVLLHHISQQGGHSRLVEALFYTAASPLSLLVKGHEAVIFFFMLSGFVLSLPMLNGTQSPYFGFLVKRFCRIYLPYILSFFVGLSIFTALTGTPDLPHGEPEFFLRGMSLSVLFEHIEGIVNVHTNSINNVYWSLIHEMRISIIFPFIVFLLMRIRWVYSIMIALLLTAAASVNTVYHFEVSNGFFTAYMDSLHYLSFFIYGFLLAKHRHRLIEMFRSLSMRVKGGLLLLAFICYMYTVYPFAYLEHVYGKSIPFNVFMRDHINAVGITIFIILSLASKQAEGLLQKRVPIFLGNISYSLYLYHVILMFALIHVFGPMPVGLLLVIVLPTSLATAYLSWRFVELPSIRLGRTVSRKWKGTTSLSYSEHSSRNHSKLREEIL